MSAMASHITNVAIVYSTVCSGADKRRYQSSASLAFVKWNAPVTGEVPAQRASNSESVFIWWRHHESLHWHWDDRLCKPNAMNKSRFHIWLNNRHNKIKHNKTTCAFYFKHLTVMNGIISMLLKMAPVDKMWNSKRFEKGLDLTQVIDLCISIIRRKLFQCVSWSPELHGICGRLSPQDKLKSTGDRCLTSPWSQVSLEDIDFITASINFDTNTCPATAYSLLGIQLHMQ